MFLSYQGLSVIAKNQRSMYVMQFHMKIRVPGTQKELQIVVERREERGEKGGEEFHRINFEK